MSALQLKRIWQLLSIDAIRFVSFTLENGDKADGQKASSLQSTVLRAAELP